MKRSYLTAVGAAVLVLAAGCGEEVGPGEVAELRFEGNETFALQLGDAQNLKVVAELGSGKTLEVTSEASIVVEGAAAEVEGTTLHAVQAGKARLFAYYDGVEAKAEVEVASAEIRSLALEGEGSFRIGEPSRVHAVATRGDGTEFRVRSGVEYATPNPEKLKVAEDGSVEVLEAGNATITAKAFGLEARYDVDLTCQYPAFSPKIQLGRVMPNLSWPVRLPDGTDIDLSFDDIYCNPEWEDTETFVLVLSAGWCVPCTNYAKWIAPQVDTLQALGMQVMIIEVEDVEGDLADRNFAWDHIKRKLGHVPVIVAGDLETKPEPGFLRQSEILQAFPTVLVIRTSDMRIIADQARVKTYLPLTQIAQHPEQDWSFSIPPFRNNCGAGQEEALEPNDAPEQAATIGAGTIEGGICTQARDFYRVDVAGEWTLELAFDNAVGDLDVYVWDEEANRPARDENGNVIGAATSNDLETFRHSGPALIAIEGYRNASAPYTLTIREGN